MAVKVQNPVSLAGRSDAGMERSAHHCLIHQTMLHMPQIAIEIVAAQQVPVHP